MGVMIVVVVVVSGIFSGRVFGAMCDPTRACDSTSICCADAIRASMNAAAISTAKQNLKSLAQNKLSDFSKL